MNYFQSCQPVKIEQILDAREQRVKTQNELIKKYKSSLISFTLNIPGEIKVYPLARMAFHEGLNCIEQELKYYDSEIVHKQILEEVTGYEAYILTASDAKQIKKIMMSLEEKHSIGRFFDIDVLDSYGIPQNGINFGRIERNCFICGQPVWKCSRNREHSAEQLANYTAHKFATFFEDSYIEKVTSSAIRALLYEVSVAPKPGLVDRLNNGSHHDMDYFLFIDSITSLIQYFREITIKSMNFEGNAGLLLQEIRYLGQDAEKKMFDITKGINTHKGAIFSMGILCASAGYLFKKDIDITANLLLDTAGEIAINAISDLTKIGDDNQTHGQKVFDEYQLTGIRGEAMKGFPSVRNCGYPKLKQLYKRGESINNAAIITLLHLISEVDDTNIVYRSDYETLISIKNNLKKILAKEKESATLLQIAEELNTDFAKMNISPGGSADLLSLSFFLFFLIDFSAR